MKTTAAISSFGSFQMPTSRRDANHMEYNIHSNERAVRCWETHPEKGNYILNRPQASPNSKHSRQMGMPTVTKSVLIAEL